MLQKKFHIDITDFKIQTLILIITGFIFYSNSFFNEYALDDGIVIEKNEYVQMGFRGIPKILSTDAYDSFYRQMNAKQQLSGGRYRPLSIVTFAIEQQLFGSKSKDSPANDIAFIRHFLNVIFYILSVVLLLYFLRNYIFRENVYIPFIACLVFLIHPIHTEVISNVKSRDEILSFLFIVLTFIAVFRYRETKKKNQLFYGLIFYFMALLSKEYAVTLLVLIPMLFYIMEGDSFKKSFSATLPFFFIAAIYLFIRFSIVGLGSTVENPDVLNNPFKYATTSEKWATKLEILNHYLRLLFYPYPLSSDYSYNTISYVNFGNVRVWAALLIHLSMIFLTVKFFFKRNILSFAFAFYLLHLFLVSNLLMDIGATMGERLVYHSSFGFVLVLSVFLSWLLQKVKNKNLQKAVSTVCICFVALWCVAKVIKRNGEWKNDTTLFIADAQTVPNSALVNGNAGKAYIDLSEKPENKFQEKELLQKAIFHLNRSIEIHKSYVNGYLNIGVAYFKLKEYDKAKENWEKARKIFPNNPYVKKNFSLLGSVYYNDAMKIGPKNLQEAINLLEKAIAADPQNVDFWYNLGGASYTAKNYKRAREAWEQTLLLNPNHQQAKQGMGALPVEKK